MAYRQYRQTKPTYSDPPVDLAFLLKDLGEPIKTFSCPSAVTADVVQLKDFKAISSYSWIDAATPTIAVPGSPRVWANTHVTRVPADKGVHYIDQNAARMQGHSPLLPLFVAIDNMNIQFRYDDLDLVTDRNNLRKLLRFVTGAKDEKDFRIDIDLAGKTCLLTRREEKNAETIVGFRGFGHEYETAATTATRGCENATGHHRIVSYDFGGLKVLLRFEVDACVVGGTNDDEFLESFSALNIETPGVVTKSPALTPIAPSALSVKFTMPRTLTPQGNMVEIKTRASHRALDWIEIYPQLYLSQTPYLYVAKHERGNFQTVEKTQLNGATMRPYAKQAEASMGKLKILLGQILEVVRKEGNNVPLSLVCRGGELVLYKRAAGSENPTEKYITNKFTGGPESK
ncbi:hypothetical protein BS17DRAFT_782437 [Gyrodon lividus]|nr:hypothetical protein BS17DRAFT_782437 [Gyrodon lividus]